MNPSEREEERLKELLEAATADDPAIRAPDSMAESLDRFREKLSGEETAAAPGARRPRRKLTLALFLFDGVVALDAVGPYESLSRLDYIEIVPVAKRRGPVRTARGGLTFTADRALDELPRPDILVVPGGPGTDAVNRDAESLAWVRAVHETSTWTASVCTGSLILAAAGVLAGVSATTHWAAVDRLRNLGVEYVAERVLRQGRILTSAGVSAGIDMGLTLVALIAGDDVARRVQLGMEYDPKPPFDCGSPEKAPARVVERVRRALEIEVARG